MNISTFSPVLTLLYVFILLWILMGVDLNAFSKVQRWGVLIAMALVCGINQVLYMLLNKSLYIRLLFPVMHLPTFFLFLYIAKRGVIKTAFMILTALVFSAPSVIINNTFKNLHLTSPFILLLTDVTTYVLILLLAHFVFRSIFNYLLTYGSRRFFLLFSLVPLVYYIYIFAFTNADISSLQSPAGFAVRLLPSLEVFCFYFLLPYIYKSLREKMVLQSTQDALQQTLSSSENQMALLNETNTKMAVYRHDMRHQLIVLEGLLTGGKTEQAREFVQTVMADLDSFTPKRFCENETVNLLCSSYEGKAQRLGVRLTVKIVLPSQLPLSDTELCSVLSNGLENALQAASQPEITDKWVDFSCAVKENKIFIQIRNPYSGQVNMQNGLPVSARNGHGYGCLSIQTIVQRNAGHCSFAAKNGVFSLRLFLPMSQPSVETP